MKRVKTMKPVRPARCECGGKMLYSEGAGGYLASCCDTCTPVTKIRRSPKSVAR